MPNLAVSQYDPPEFAQSDTTGAINWLLLARRQAMPVVIGCLIALLCAEIYIANIVPQYTAISVLFVDNRKVNAVRDAYDFPAAGFDPAEATAVSVAAILKSDKVLSSVADKLELLNDSSFTDVPPGLLEKIFGFGAARAEKSPGNAEAYRQRVLDQLRSNLSVRHFARTQVIEISYTATDPLAAAKIANAFADAYIADQLDAKYQATSRASNWLKERLDELKQGVLGSDLAVQKFKARLVGANPVSNESLAMLRELESKSASYRHMYAIFLQRYQETVQQESFPITDARVISSAKTGNRSNGGAWRIIAFSLFIGGLAGAGLGFLREAYDRGFRTSKQIRTELGLELLGMLPLVKQPRTRKRQPWSREAEDVDWQQVDLQQNTQLMQPASGILGHVVDNPRSHYTEILNSVKVALDLMKLPAKNSQLIGITSVFPSEGKSTTAKNLGSLLAQLGFETLLIDADLRNRGLSRHIAPEADRGIAEAVVAGKPIKDLVYREPHSKLAILPATSRNGAAQHGSELLTSPGMRAVLEQAQRNFTYVLLDLPPLGLFVDARAMAPQVDAFILVVEWGQSARKLVQDMLATERMVREKCLGVVLNKTDFEKLRLYEDYGSREYYLHKYAKSRSGRAGS